MQKIKISSLGCCVSREMLNYSKNLVVVRSAYNNFNTMLEKPVNIPFEVCSKAININFQARNVYLELNKKVFDFLAEEKCDYLILDFAEVITPNIEVCFPDEYMGENCSQKQIKIPLNDFTLSVLNELNISYKKVPFDESLVDKIVDFLFLNLQKIVPIEKIILNRTTLSEKNIEDIDNKFILKDNLENYRLEKNRKALVRRFEDSAMNKLTKQNIVLEPLENTFSEKNHKYGNSPVHYSFPSYEFMISRLEYKLGIISVDQLYESYEKVFSKMSNYIFNLETIKSSSNAINVNKDKTNLVLQTSFKVNAEDSQFNSMVLYNKLKSYKYYKLVLKGIQLSNKNCKKITIALKDCSAQKMMIIEDFVINNKIEFEFVTNNIEFVELKVYAGIHGMTNNNELTVRTAELYESL